jgi:hypothetical protein
MTNGYWPFIAVAQLFHHRVEDDLLVEEPITWLFSNMRLLFLKRHRVVLKYGGEVFIQFFSKTRFYISFVIADVKLFFLKNFKRIIVDIEKF